MRAAGEGRKGKFEATRLVGIGMMLSGVLAFTFAVAGPSGAGATSGATPQHHSVECQQTSTSGTMGAVAWAISRGCQTTTTHHMCGCSTTTTTTYGDTTTTASTTTTSTTTSTTMAPSTSVAGETSTIVTTTTVPEDTTTSTTTAGVMGSTTTLDTSVSGNNVTTSIGVKGATASLPPSIQTSPTSGVLPFTGGSPAPLAGLGLVLLGTGAGLSRRKRRLAD